MKPTKLLMIFLSVGLFFVSAFPAHAERSAPSLASSAKAAALYHPDTETFIFEKNSHERLKMASTTKIMTALLAIESGALDTTVSVPPIAVGTEGSSLYLSAGDSGTLRDFVYALMLSSANDAAVTIACALSGSVESFASEMNLRAASLGLTDTFFENPHGLDSEMHFTSAHDLALITAEAMQNPTFCEIVKTVSKTIYLNDGETVRHLHNHNRLLSRFSGAIGVKTGFTKASGRCLVSAAERDGVRMIAVTLHCPDDWNTHSSLLTYGLSRYSRSLLAEKGSLAFTLPVIGGNENSLIVSNPDHVYAAIPEGADITTRFDVVRMPSAPIRKGDVLGKVSFFLGDKLIAEVPLTAENSVKEIRYRFSFFSLFH